MNNVNVNGTIFFFSTKSSFRQTSLMMKIKSFEKSKHKVKNEELIKQKGQKGKLSKYLSFSPYIAVYYNT